MKQPHLLFKVTVLSVFLSLNAMAETREDMLKTLFHSGNRSFMGMNNGQYYVALDTWGLTAEVVQSIAVSIEMEQIVISVEYELFGQESLPEFQHMTQFTVIPIPNPGHRKVLARMKDGKNILPFLGDGPYRDFLDEMVHIEYAEKGQDVSRVASFANSDGGGVQVQSGATPPSPTASSPAPTSSEPPP